MAAGAALASGFSRLPATAGFFSTFLAGASSPEDEKEMSDSSSASATLAAAFALAARALDSSFLAILETFA